MDFVFNRPLFPSVCPHTLSYPDTPASVLVGLVHVVTRPSSPTSGRPSPVYGARNSPSPKHEMSLSFPFGVDEKMHPLTVLLVDQDQTNLTNWTSKIVTFRTQTLWGIRVRFST